MKARRGEWEATRGELPLNTASKRTHTPAENQKVGTWQYSMVNAAMMDVFRRNASKFASAVSDNTKVEFLPVEITKIFLPRIGADGEAFYPRYPRNPRFRLRHNEF